MNKALFVDKDGTLVDNSGYPEIISTHFLLENDVVEGLKYAKNKGYKIIIVSNQSWIAKNRMSKDEVENVFKILVEKLKEKCVEIDDYFYCPHQPSDNCECRKPKAKLIFDAAKKHDIDLSQSFMIGDKDSDVLAGKNAGIKTILVKTGEGKNYLQSMVSVVDIILNNLNEINSVI